MPGLDHEVHPSTVAGDKYGCNGPSRRKAMYWAPNLAMRMAPPTLVWEPVSDNSSKDCRYDLSLKDSRCEECPRRGQGEKYDQLIRSKGT